MMKLKLWKKYENLPYLETDTALHVRKVGILEKVEIGPTDKACCMGEAEALTASFLEVRAGGALVKGLGVFAGTVGSWMWFALTLGLIRIYGNSTFGAHWGPVYYLMDAMLIIGWLLVGLGVLQAFSYDSRPVRDFQYRLSRKSGRLYEWWNGRVLESRFEDLVPCYHRVGIGTATSGSFVLVDLDRNRGLVRRIYHMAGLVGSDPRLSQWGWEYLRRYMAGEFDRLPVMPQAAPLQSGFAGIARDFAPARWGRTLIARLGPLGYLLAFPLIVVVGLLTGLPWLYTTLADLRLTLPDWSRTEQADSGAEMSPPLEHLLARDPQLEARRRIAAWEAPLYGVVMLCGSALWLVLIGWMFNWIHGAFAR